MPVPAGGRWFAAQVIRIRKRLSVRPPPPVRPRGGDKNCKENPSEQANHGVQDPRGGHRVLSASALGSKQTDATSVRWHLLGIVSLAYCDLPLLLPTRAWTIPSTKHSLYYRLGLGVGSEVLSLRNCLSAYALESPILTPAVFTRIRFYLNKDHGPSALVAFWIFVSAR